VGDVNGSNNPGTRAKSGGMLALDQNEIIKASPGDIIEIPVRVSGDANIGAISMVAAKHRRQQSRRICNAGCEINNQRFPATSTDNRRTRSVGA